MSDIQKKLICVVVPVYKAEKTIRELYERLVVSLGTISPDFEMILVEDSGCDRSWDIIAEISKADARVTGICLSRNYGQHHAITAGLDHSDADWVIVMDCDLQDQPEEIGKLYNKALEGYDCVMARRMERKDSYFKKISSAGFHWFLGFLSDIKHDPSISCFGIYSRRLIDNVKLYREQFRSLGALVELTGFSRTAIPVCHAPRSTGKSTYTFQKRCSLALNTIVAFSNKPLVLAIQFGFIGASLSFLCIAYLLVRYFSTGVPVPGWTSTIASIYLVGSILLINMGFIGLYVGKVFNETKRRPLYTVKCTTKEPAA